MRSFRNLASSAARIRNPVGRGFKGQDPPLHQTDGDSRRPAVAIAQSVGLSASASYSAPSMTAGARPRPERGLLLRLAACAKSRCTSCYRVQEVVADAALDLGSRPRAVARNSMPRTQEGRVAGDVHVHQVARAGPFVAIGRLSCWRERPKRRSIFHTVLAQDRLGTATRRRGHRFRPLAHRSPARARRPNGGDRDLVGWSDQEDRKASLARCYSGLARNATSGERSPTKR